MITNHVRLIHANGERQLDVVVFRLVRVDRSVKSQDVPLGTSFVSSHIFSNPCC
jgi:hypothetical protein